MLKWLASPGGQIITWALVLGTTAFSAWNSRRISRNGSRRAEARSAIDQAQQQIQELNRQAEAYWTEVDSARSGSPICRKSRGLTRDLDLLDQLLSGLSDRHPRLDVIREFVEFRRQITANPFETEQKKCLAPSNPRLAMINDAARELSFALENRFKDYFK